MLRGFFNVLKGALLLEVDLDGDDGMEAYLFSFIPISICMLGSAFAEVSMPLAIFIAWAGMTWGFSVYIRSFYTYWARRHWGQPNPLTGFFWWTACIIGICCGLASLIMPDYSNLLSGSATLMVAIPALIKYLQIRSHRLANTWRTIPEPAPFIMAELD